MAGMPQTWGWFEIWKIMLNKYFSIRSMSIGQFPETLSDLFLFA